MTLSLNTYPTVPPSRTALTSAEIKQYITNISWANFQAVKTLLESVENQLLATPVTYRQASLPDTAKASDRWIDTSLGEQEKYCINGYGSGDGTTGDWISLRDATTLAVAQSAASDAAEAKLLNAADFPSAYTKDWLYVNSTTGVVYVCIETYTASFTGDKSTKFQALVDGTTSALVGNIQTQVDNFADDNIISSIEKRALQREWLQIQDNKVLADTLASSQGLTGASTYIALVASYDILDDYLNNTLNLFDNLDSDTSLAVNSTTRTEWNTRWKTYYSSSKAYSNTVEDTLNQDIDSIQTDETITQAESMNYEIHWNYEVKNYEQHDNTTDSLESSGLIDKTTNAEWLAYDLAYSEMNTYLNTTLDLFNNTEWPFSLPENGSSATEWRAKWQALTDAERDVSNLTNGAFASQIDALADDGTISKGGEKILANQAWGNIYGTDGLDGEYALLTNRANALIAGGNDSLESPRDSLTSAYTALKSYLDGLSDFYDTTVDTVVVNAIWDANWNLYYTKYAALDKAASDIADTDLGLVSGLVNDEAVTAGKEKQELIELFDQLTTERSNMQTRASIGVGADITAYEAAYQALRTFLYGLFADTGDGANFNNKDLGATSVNRSVWKQKFDDYYNEREALQTQIIDNNVTNLNKDSAAIPTMGQDGEITPEEKAVAKVYWNVIFGTDPLPDDDGEHNALSTQATALGVTQSYIDNFDDAFVRLWNFLTDNSHGTPVSVATPLDLFTDMGASTMLDAAQQTYWQQYWAEYYDQRDTITIQIQAQLQAELDSKLPRDGSLEMTGTLGLGGFVIYNMAQAAAAGQAVEYQQWIDAIAQEVINRNAAISAHAGLTAAHGVTTVAGLDEVQTLTNKTLTAPVITGATLTGTSINASSNPITNLPFSAFASGVVDTDLSVVSGAHNTLVTAKAVKDYYGEAGDNVSQLFGVKVTTSGGAGTTHTLDLLGCGINTTAGADWTNASFSMRGIVTFDNTVANNATFSINFHFSKQSGSGNIQVNAQGVNHYGGTGAADSVFAGEGVFILTGDTVTITPTTLYNEFQEFTIERVDTANELCFRFSTVSQSSRTLSMAGWMEGVRTFSGSFISPGQGTKYLVEAIAGSAGGGGGTSVAAQGTSEMFTCHGETASGSNDGPIIGTRIDVTDTTAFNNSSFNLMLRCNMRVSSVLDIYPTEVIITKESGGTIQAHIRVFRDNWSGVHNANDFYGVGSLASNGSTVEALDVNSNTSNIFIERVDTGNELAFRLTWSGTNWVGFCTLSGLRSYEGVDVGSSGSITQQNPIVVSTGDITQEYAAYILDNQVAAATSSWESAPIGTRLDVNDSAYTNSTFNLRFNGRINCQLGGNVNRIFHVSGVIKKNAGAEPSVAMTATIETISGVYTGETKGFFGSLASNGAEVNMSFTQAAITTGFGTPKIVRSDVSNELCFRLAIDYYTTVTEMNFFMEMSGPRAYTGTLVSSSNGIEF